MNDTDPLHCQCCGVECNEDELIIVGISVDDINLCHTCEDKYKDD